MQTGILEIDIIKNVLQKKGYLFFEKGRYNLNIIGIRANNREAGKFDDFICCIYKNHSGNWVCDHWRATTDAGTYWLGNPMNKNGTALLVPDQYISAYKLGLFKNRYAALIQDRPLKVYRDNNKNKILDFVESSIQEGMFGIHIHKSHPNLESKINDKWSAGCQVFANAKNFNDFMSLVEKSVILWNDKFTYTLLEEKDFSDV